MLGFRTGERSAPLTLGGWCLAILFVASAGSVGLACGSEGGGPAFEAATAPPVANQTPQTEEGPAGVVNYTRVDATVACAGATPPEAIADLKRRGFVSIINFRTAEERGATVEASKAAAAEAGLKYFHLPFGTATAEVTEQFLDRVSDPSNQPVFIHCGSANRVGAMWFIKRVKVDGWDTDRAMAEAEAIGLRSQGLKEFATSYVQR